MAVKRKDPFVSGFDGGSSNGGSGKKPGGIDRNGFDWGPKDHKYGVNKSEDGMVHSPRNEKKATEKFAGKTPRTVRDKNVSQSAAAAGNDLLNKHRDKRTDEVYNYGTGGARDYARKITQEQNAMGMTRNEKGRETTDMYRSLGKIGPEYAHNKYSRTSRKANEEANKINNIDRDNEEARFTQPGRPMRNYLYHQKQRAAEKAAKADVKKTTRKK